MVDLKVTNLNGLDAALDESTVAEFKEALRGPLIEPGDEGYDEQRQVWNRLIDRRPALSPGAPGRPTSFSVFDLHGTVIF